MSKGNEQLTPGLQTKLRLIRNSRPQAITLTLSSLEKREYTRVISSLVMLDTLAITGITAFNLLWVSIPESCLYPANILLFMVLARLVTLYNLSSSPYIVGKMTLLSLGFLCPQLILFLLAEAPIAITSTSMLLSLILFTFITVSHHKLTQTYVISRECDFYFYLEQTLKRMLDIVLAVVGLAMAFPLLVTTSLFIWLEDRGPALIAQTRVGLNEEKFQMYKFRSMRITLDTHQPHIIRNTPELFKMKNDPRITALGRIIRKLSIDEIPQLWNVLKGDMALVGPRPPLPSECLQMNAEHRLKFRVKPGITGLWQVTGRVLNERHFDMVAKYDNQYIDNWCLMEDLKIILQTIPVVLLQKGAY